MAPSRRASVQQGRQTAAQTLPATPRIPRHRRSRSASPPRQPIPVRFRDEPPARSTRSAFAAPPIVATMPTATQRIPIDCPFTGCRASTAHQHLPQLQYYHPRAGRAVHYRGYGTSSRDNSSRPRRAVTLQRARQDNDESVEGPVVAENEEAAEPGQESEAQPVVTSDIEIDAQEPPAQELAQNTAPASSPFEARAEGGEPPATYASPADNAMRDDDNTSTLFQPPRTPPPSSPPAAEEIPSNISPVQHDEQQQQTPLPPLTPNPIQFGDYLPNHPPNHSPVVPTPHTLTYDELIRPFLAPHLPPAPGMEGITAMLQEFRSLTDRSYRPAGLEEEEEEEEDWEDWLWE